MKWVLLAAFIAMAACWFSFLKTDKRAVLLSGLLIGFLPFVIGSWHLMLAPYSFAGWLGYCKGWELTLIDCIAFAVLMTAKLKTPGRPMIWFLLFYIAAVAVSVPMAKYPMFAAGYLVQLLRMLLIFMAVSALAAREDGAKGVLYGLIAGLSLQCFFALQARAGGALQTGGSFGHQNLLGFVSHMVLLPSFGALLGGRWPRVALLGVVASAIVIILTASRATIMIAGIGVVVTYIACAATNWNSRKGTFGAITLGMLVIAAPLAQESLGRRFTANGGKMFTEDVEREGFERAANMMIHDHPMGVGPNHYAFAANVDDYNNKANVTAMSRSRATNVHNGYLLVNAETGYLGLISFCTLLFGILGATLYYGKMYRRQGYSDIIVGVGCAMFSIAIHNKFEWMFVTFQAQYVIYIGLGLGSGCVLLSRRKLAQRRKAPPPREVVEAVPEAEEAQPAWSA